MTARVRRRVADSAGISLLEVVVASALLGTIVAVFSPVLISSFRSGEALEGQARALDQIRIVVDRIDAELRSAECISQPAAGGTGETLSFTTRTGTGPAYDVTYALDGSRLVRTTDAGAGVVQSGLSASTVSFGHTAIAGERARITIHVEAASPAGGTPRSVDTAITGRNAWQAC